MRKRMDSPKSEKKLSRSYFVVIAVLMMVAMSGIVLSQFPRHDAEFESQKTDDEQRRTRKKPKTVIEAIAEEQAAHKQVDRSSANDASGTAPLAMTEPGVSFKPESEPPSARLVNDPELGEVIELRYADGSTLYKMNDRVYDWGSGEIHSFDEEP